MSESIEGSQVPPRLRWMSRAEMAVRADMKEPFSEDLERGFGKSDVREITVHVVFAGFNSDQQRKLIQGVEVRRADRCDSHIVKLGRADEMLKDHEGRRTCAGNRTIRGRMFVRVRSARLPGGR